MKEARCEFGLTAWNGNLYAFGGWVGCDMGASVEVYDPFMNEWKTCGRIPEPRFGMGVVSFEGNSIILLFFPGVTRAMPRADISSSYSHP